MRSPRTHALWTDLNYPHFVTSVTNDRIPIFADPQAAEMLLAEMKFYAECYDVLLIAAVIMPDHFHAIIWPRGAKTFSDYMRGVKSFLAKRINHYNRRGPLPPSHNENPMPGQVTRPIARSYPGRPVSEVKTSVWQDSFFDYVIESDAKLEEKIWYIIRNPVEEGLISEDEMYPYLIVHPDYDLR